ncbi:putative ABC transporter permease [Breznakiella homolactica]|uniref:Putative ABC transporter permease n=1 Tax=Breznakiella homolactica TaxID=2798577 RepID=A0A7T8BBJ0_9SPIR|nr:putative ABC transporter permease [Breznakiella homolactica]
MVIQSFSDIVFYFLFFSFIGWLGETLVHLILYRQLVNKGFLYGPYSPMYGVAALVLIIFRTLLPVPLPVFIAAAVVFYIIYEYLGSVVLEKMTNIRWWNYSNRKLQIRGRVYIPKAVFYALLMSLLIYFGRPWTGIILEDIPSAFIRLIASGIIIILLVDQYFSLKLLADFEDRTTQWIQVYYSLSKEDQEFLLNLKNDSYRTALKDFPPELLEKMGTTAQKSHSGYRLLRSFPNLEITGKEGSINALKEVLSRDRKEKRPGTWKRFKAWLRNYLKSTDKEEGAVYTGKLSIYKLFWVFLVGGVIGYVVETLFALVTRGVLESRQGVIYGPFNQVYGIGAVIMVVALMPLARKRDSVIFLGAALIGGAFEWVCSFVQEKVFKTVSWGYDDSTFSIGSSGRTSLVFMLFWGILGVLFIKFILPRLLTFIDRLLKKQGYTMTIVLMVLIVADLALSAVAVYRWSLRQDGVPPANNFESFLDKQYPNEFMEEIYPSMRKPTYLQTNQINADAAAVVRSVKGSPILSHFPKLIWTPCFFNKPTVTILADAPKGVRLPPIQEPMSRPNI